MPPSERPLCEFLEYRPVLVDVPMLVPVIGVHH
jgi:hypothetical protein